MWPFPKTLRKAVSPVANLIVQIVNDVKKYTSQVNLVKILQCDKLDLNCQEISQEMGVNLHTV